MLSLRSLLLLAGCCALLGCTALNRDFASRSTTRGTPINSAATVTTAGGYSSFAAAPPSGAAPSLALSPNDSLPSVAAAPPPISVAQHAPEKLYNLEPAEKRHVSSSAHKTQVPLKQSAANGGTAEEVLTPVGDKAEAAATAPSSHANTEDMDAVLPVRKGSRSGATARSHSSEGSKNSPQSSLRPNVKSSIKKSGEDIMRVSNPVQPEPQDPLFTS